MASTTLEAFAVVAVFLAGIPILVSGAEGDVPEATCVAGQGTRQTPLPQGGKIKIACPAGSALQTVGGVGAEAAKAAQVFRAADGDAISIETLIPAATYEQANDANTLFVPQLPSAATPVIFKCGADNEQKCDVEIQVPASPELGPNVCVALGTEIQFSVREADQEVNFSCGRAINTLHPPDPNLYQEDCQETVAINNVLPGAIFTRSANQEAFHNLRVPNLPQNDVTVCVVCVADAGHVGERDNRCAVKIRVFRAGPVPPVNANAGVDGVLNPRVVDGERGRVLDVDGAGGPAIARGGGDPPARVDNGGGPGRDPPNGQGPPNRGDDGNADEEDVFLPPNENVGLAPVGRGQNRGVGGGGIHAGGVGQHQPPQAPNAHAAPGQDAQPNPRLQPMQPERPADPRRPAHPKNLNVPVALRPPRGPANAADHPPPQRPANPADAAPPRGPANPPAPPHPDDPANPPAPGSPVPPKPSGVVGIRERATLSLALLVVSLEVLYGVLPARR